jgi:hypothetical protein
MCIASDRGRVVRTPHSSRAREGTPAATLHSMLNQSVQRGPRAALLGGMWDALPYFSASDGQIGMAGYALQVKGVSWFGADGVGRVPDGLWAHNVSFYLNFLADNGFNLLRLPFALDNLFDDSIISI